MVQLYYGDGKGKTTAAVGAAVRAAGAGASVLFVSFYKDGSSCEVAALERLGVQCLFPREQFQMFCPVTAEKQAALAADYARLLTEIDVVAADCFLVVLDEGADAFAGDLLPQQAVLDFLQRHGKDREIILTGHSLPADLAPLCDYVTRMTKERHPLIPARRHGGGSNTEYPLQMAAVCGRMILLTEPYTFLHYEGGFIYAQP